VEAAERAQYLFQVEITVIIHNNTADRSLSYVTAQARRAGKQALPNWAAVLILAFRTKSSSNCRAPFHGAYVNKGLLAPYLMSAILPN